MKPSPILPGDHAAARSGLRRFGFLVESLVTQLRTPGRNRAGAFEFTVAELGFVTNSFGGTAFTDPESNSFSQRFCQTRSP
jgi:hypothetical protein